jgi:hypothetical protein
MVEMLAGQNAKVVPTLVPKPGSTTVTQEHPTDQNLKINVLLSYHRFRWVGVPVY